MRHTAVVPELTVLHTNDFHGTLRGDLFSRLSELRAHSDLYFDSGDAIKTGNLGVPLKPEAVWPLLDDLGCNASVLGNRETHVLESAFRAKLAGSRHPILCANLRKKDGSRPLPGHLVIGRNGIRVGVVAVMVPMVTNKMKTQAASGYLWDPPIPIASEVGNRLRPEVDLLIALTHIGHKQDLALAEQCPHYDAVLGGHSHTVLEKPVWVGKTAVCQGGSHGRFAGVYRWSPAEGWSGGLQDLSPTG